MATIGRSSAVAYFGRFTMQGYAAWLLWDLVHIYLLIGFRTRFAVFVNWMWSWITYGRGARLITGPVSFRVRTPRQTQDRRSDGRERSFALTCTHATRRS